MGPVSTSPTPGHDVVRALLAAEIDFALAPGERDAVDRHLAGCDSCRAIRAALVADARSLRQAHRVPPPGRVHEAVLIALTPPAPRQPGASRHLLVVLPAIILAALVAVAAIVLAEQGLR